MRAIDDGDAQLSRHHRYHGPRIEPSSIRTHEPNVREAVTFWLGSAHDDGLDGTDQPDAAAVTKARRIRGDEVGSCVRRHPPCVRPLRLVSGPTTAPNGSLAQKKLSLV